MIVGAGYVISHWIFIKVYEGPCQFVYYGVVVTVRESEGYRGAQYLHQKCLHHVLLFQIIVCLKIYNWLYKTHTLYKKSSTYLKYLVLATFCQINMSDHVFDISSTRARVCVVVGVNLPLRKYVCLWQPQLFYVHHYFAQNTKIL